MESTLPDDGAAVDGNEEEEEDEDEDEGVGDGDGDGERAAGIVSGFDMPFHGTPTRTRYRTVLLVRSSWWQDTRDGQAGGAVAVHRLDAL